MWPAKLFYVTRESFQGAQLFHPVPINYTRSNCGALTEHSQGCMETALYPLSPNAFLNAVAKIATLRRQLRKRLGQQVDQFTPGLQDWATTKGVLCVPEE